MQLDKRALQQLVADAALAPQEQLKPVNQNNKKLFIGIPKETTFQENRVPLTPESVQLLVARGHDVLIETNAGASAKFSDRDYSEAGAEIVYDKKAVFKANIILKIEPLTEEELDLINDNQTIFSAIQLSVQPEKTLRKLMSKKVTAVAYDFLMDNESSFPMIRSMGEIAGNYSILIAAELMSTPNIGSGLMMGSIAGVPPTEVVIIGAGTVAQNAAQSAVALGAEVKVFDNSISRLRRLQDKLGERIFTSIIDPQTLGKALSSADVCIGALRGTNGRTPCVVTEKMVQNMKQDAVIIDVSIDQGGVAETSRPTSHEQPIFTKHGVIHYCVPNIASRVAKTASYAISNIFAPLLLDISENGGVKDFIKYNCGFRNGIYMYNGNLTSKIIGERLSLPYKDLELLIAAL